MNNNGFMLDEHIYIRTFTITIIFTVFGFCMFLLQEKRHSNSPTKLSALIGDLCEVSDRRGRLRGEVSFRCLNYGSSPPSRCHHSPGEGKTKAGQCFISGALVFQIPKGSKMRVTSGLLGCISRHTPLSPPPHSYLSSLHSCV